MWWGTAIEAPDPAALASFYSELLGWPISHQEPGTAILAAPEGSIYIVFQEAHDYEPPVWPPVDGAQRTMMHFDFQVGDLDSAVAEAVALGASVALTNHRRTSGCCLIQPATPSACVGMMANCSWV
jgi:predicted enzyme related to lactoylglutathione lyase